MISPVKFSPVDRPYTAAEVVSGKFAAGTFQRVRGSFTSDAAGTLSVRWRDASGALALEYDVPLCTDITFANVYHFDVIRQGDYFEYEFTFAANATFLRAEVIALNDA